MIRVLVGILVLLGAVLGAGLFIPVGTVLDFAGAGKQGIEWSAAKGSVLSGRLEGIKVKGKDYGSADYTLIPGALTRGKLKFDIGWSGASGTGTSEVTFDRSKSVLLEDFAFDIDLASLPQMARFDTLHSGRVKLQGPSMLFTDNRCEAVTGTARSDLLELNTQAFGDDWSAFEGNLACEDGALLVPLAAENSLGTRFTAMLRAVPGAPSKFEARISGKVPKPLAFALPLAGFARDGEEFVYVPKKKKSQAVKATAP